MPAKGTAHFDQYTPQTRAKHEIFEKYLGAYLKAVSGRVSAYHYIDGFAGTGSYAQTEAGSAPIAVSLLANCGKPAAATLIEENRNSHAQLQRMLTESRDFLHLVEPQILHGLFADHIASALQHPIYGTHRPVATFALVDPCGVRGVRMSDLSRLLAMPYAECLMFWNYDGLNRWLGGIRAGTASGDELREFLGGDRWLAAAIECHGSSSGPADKERRLRSLFAEAVRAHCRAQFILPFRFTSTHADRTSHYLVHCCGNSLGFKIRKEVMYTAGVVGGDSGTFEFQAPGVAEQGDLFASPAIDAARTAVLEELQQGARRVSLFTEEWVLRPDDRYVAQQYRGLLLDLEKEGLVTVFDETGRTSAPALARKARRGTPTLASRLVVRHA